MTSSSIPDLLIPRYCICQILHQVLEQGHPLDQIYEDALAPYRVDTQNRHFIRHMVMVGLRNIGRIDAILSRLSTTPFLKIAPAEVRTLLRLGAIQILYSQVTEFAAVDTTVDLAVATGFARQKGMVNAVLRNLIRQKEEFTEILESDSYALPEWIYKSWADSYGTDAVRDIIKVTQTQAPFDMSLKPNQKVDFDDQAVILPSGTVRLENAQNITALEGFQEGIWWAQDVAASIPVLLLERAMESLDGKTIIDLCAAPGGKTAQMAARGANVVAVDRSASRLRTLKDNAQRLDLKSKIEIVCEDALKWQSKSAFDAILLDAPCSATGTLRRNPDVLWLKDQSDLKKLQDLQKSLLDHAFNQLSSGGILVYCTCSLQPEEGEAQIDTFLKTHPNAQRAVMDLSDWDLQHAITKSGDVRLLPCYYGDQGGMDGFFISIIRKN
jgi:16S rRNA (cytosine967-C5)-methyltransferase